MVWSLAATLVVALVLVAFAPMIASRLAPRYVARQVNSSIPGRVDIGQLALSWGGPSVVGPVVVTDPKGVTVANLNIETSTGVWSLGRQALSGGGYDLGTVKLAGQVDVVRESDGKTNIERAFGLDQPRPPQPQPQQKGLPEQRLKALVDVEGLDVTFTDRTAPPNSPTAAGVALNDFSGTIDLDYRGGANGAAALKADLAGAVQAGNGQQGAGGVAAGDQQRILADASANLDAAGNIADGAVNLNVTNVPTPLVDVLAGLGGTLAPSIGPRADLVVDAAGTLDNATAAMTLTAEGAGADVRMAYDGAHLTLSEPGRVWARSTEFLAGTGALEQASKTVRLDKAPGVELALERLDLPLPKAVLTGETPFDSVDLRGGSIAATMRVDQMQGQIATPAGGNGQAAGADNAAAEDWQPFTVEPTDIAVRSDDLAQGVSLTAASRATVSGDPAGQLNVEANAGGILDENGRLVRGLPRQLQGDARLTGVSSSLLQPIVEGAGLPVQMRDDVGPTVDLTVSARSAGPGEPIQAQDGQPPAAGGIPPTDIQATINSQNIRGMATGRLEPGSRLDVPSAEVRVGSASGLIGRLLAPKATPAANEQAAGAEQPAAQPIAVAGTGGLTATLRDASIPLNGSGGLDLANLDGRADVVVSDLAVTPMPETGPIQADNAHLQVAFAKQKSPRAQLDSKLSHQRNPFTLNAAILAPGLVAPKPQDGAEEPSNLFKRINDLHLDGEIRLTDLPESLVRSIPGLAPDPNAAPTDTTAQAKALIRGLIGQRATVVMGLNQAASEADGSNTVVRTDVVATSVTVNTAATLSPTAVSVDRAVMNATVTPEAADGLLAALSAPAPEQPGAAPAAPAAPAQPMPPMRLAKAANLRFTLQPVTIPVAADPNAGPLGLDLAHAGDIVGTLATTEPVMLDNVPIAGRTATVGVRGLSARVEAPPAMLLRTAAAAPGQAAPQAVAKITGELLRGVDSLAKVQADVRGAIGGGGGGAGAGDQAAAAGPMQVNASITQIRTPVLDDLLGQGGTLPGVLGNEASLKLVASTGANQSLNAEVTADSPRLKTSPVKVTGDAQRISIAQPLQAVWTPDPAWLNERAFGAAGAPAPAPAPGPSPSPSPSPAPAPRAAPGAPAQPPRTGPRFDTAQPPTFNLAVDRLVLSRPGGAGDQATGAFKPGVFDLAATVTSPRLAVLPGTSGGNGQAQAPLVLEGVRATARTVNDRPGVLTAEFAANATGGPAAPAGGAPAASTGTATIANIADARGNLTTDKAVVDANVNVQAFPTPVIDAVANQGGLLAELLGPTVNLTAQANQLSMAGGGTLRATANADRASAKLGGEVKGGAFVQKEPVEVRITEIRPELVQRIGPSLPVIGSLQKTKNDEPAVITGDALTVPIDGDMTKLNGNIVADLGVAQFTTKGVFQELLKIAGQRQAGTVGRKLEPFNVHMTRGVLNYDRFKLPLGEFDLETRGVVDLVNRRVDIVTYAPFFALSDEAAGSLNTNLSSLFGKVIPGGIDRLTMVPIRTSGSLDDPKTAIDPELFAQEFGNNLINAPGRMLEDVIKRPLDDLFNKGGKKDQPPPKK